MPLTKKSYLIDQIHKIKLTNFREIILALSTKLSSAKNIKIMDSKTSKKLRNSEHKHLLSLDSQKKKQFKGMQTVKISTAKLTHFVKICSAKISTLTVQ